MSDVYLSPSEVSEHYGPSERTLARWRKTGIGPRFVRIGPRRIAYKQSEWEALTAANTFASLAEESARHAGRPACLEAV